MLLHPEEYVSSINREVADIYRHKYNNGTAFYKSYENIPSIYDKI